MLKRHRPLVAGVAIAAFLAGPAGAAPRDLIGVRAGQAESSLGNRGYVFDHNEGRTQLWWSDHITECVAIEVSDGRYSDINARPSGDCRLYRDDGKKKGSNSGAVIAGALAIGILAAAAASANKKKHKDDRYEDRYDDRGGRAYSPERGVDCYPDQRACYERGRGYSAYWTNREFRYRY